LHVSPHPHRSFAIAAAAALLCLLLGETPAAGATRSSQGSRNVTLLAHLNQYHAYSACCRYVHSDGREYAILGTDTGTSIVNITDPAAPYEVGFIPGAASAWREMKQYRSWVYISTEGGGGIQIVRMTDPEHPVLVGAYTTNFNRAHTVAVDTTRALLILNGTRLDAVPTGMRILSLADPENPVEVGAYTSDYVHDSWVRNDTLYASCIQSATMRIFDLHDPSNPLEIVSWNYPDGRTHSAETSTNGRYLYVCDELNYGTMKVFDLQHPLVHPLIRKITVNPLAIVHNVHVKRDTAFVAYYTEGVRLFDVSEPDLPAEWGWYDTYGSFSGGFHGVWDVASFPSGNFIASDIESGLYVFRANPDYGTIRVLVQGADVPGPLSGADLVSDDGDSTRTQDFGTARLALAPGSHTLTIRKFGYETATRSFVTALGAHDSLVVTLTPAQKGSITGTVERAGDHAPLPDATIEFLATPLRFATLGDGSYARDGVPAGTYRVRCDRAGYAPEERDITVLGGSTPQVEPWALLQAAWYDSCDADKGWSLGAPGDDAIDGLWVRAIPVASNFGPAARMPQPWHGAAQHDVPDEGGFTASGPVQPGDDASPGVGACFVTGNGLPGGDPANSDVDQGRTTLTSPPLDASGMAEPTIAFRRWYYMNTPGEPDSMLVELSADGRTWIIARSIRESDPEWTLDILRLKDFIAPGSRVRVRFVAQDEGPNGIVEGAVDDIELFDAALVPSTVVDLPGNGTPPAILGAPRPNPAPGSAHITLRLRDAGTARVRVYDVAGRWVATLHDGPAEAGPMTLVWDGRDQRGKRVSSGVYWIHAEAGGERLIQRLVLTR